MKTLSYMLAAAFAACVSSLSGSVAVAAPQYTIAPLDSGGSPDVYVKGINNHGQIVGYTVDGGGASHATLWDSTGPHELPYLSDNHSSEAYRINDAGQIAGKAAVTATGTSDAAYWDSAGVIDCGSLGTSGSFAQDISESGQVVGSSWFGTGIAKSHAFVWTKAGGMVDYGNAGIGNQQAGWNGINSSGKLVGTAYVLFSPFKASMGQVGTPGVTVISPASQFSTGMALAVNDAGTIVGYQNHGSGSPSPAIFNGDGTVQFLDITPLNLVEGWAQDISTDGTIVGRAFGSDIDGNQISKSFVNIGGQTYDFESLIDPSSGWTLFFEAAGVNDLGQIVGEGIYNGQITGFVMTPVPEPATVGVIAIGAIGLLARRRRAV